MQAQENTRQDAMKDAMLHAIRTLIRWDTSQKGNLRSLFLENPSGFDGYTDSIEKPIGLMDIL